MVFVVSICALIVTTPFLAVVVSGLNFDAGVWKHLVNFSLPLYLRNTLILMLLVGLASVSIGTYLGWLVCRYDFPLRRLMRWALLLPIAMPAYVLAYSYTELLEYSGPVQGFVRATFNIVSGEKYWFPEIRSIGGAAWILTAVLYPYVYLFAYKAFDETSPSLFQVTQSLGKSTRSLFWQVALPIARPAIVAGLALVLMEVLNDFGTVEYFSIPTLSLGVYDTWFSMGSIHSAAQISIVMLFIVFGLLWLESRARTTRKYYQSGIPIDANAAVNRQKRGWAMTLLCAVPILVGFFIPLAPLALAMVMRTDLPEIRMALLVGNTVGLGIAATLICLALGLMNAFYQRYISRFQRDPLVNIARGGYALPGIVLALGIMAGIALVTRSVNSIAQLFGSTEPILSVSGTIGLILIAYCVRFLTVAIGAINTSLEKVPPSQDEALQVMGYSKERGFIKLVLPQLRSGLITAAILVFFDCVKELPATLILRPFNFDTLSTFVYQYASDERLYEAAPAALAIALVGLLPVYLLSLGFDRDERQL